MLFQFFKKYRCDLRRLFLAVAPLFIFSITIYCQVTALTTANPLAGNTLNVYFLNVGQGNCILVKLPSGKFMLYDGGTSTSRHKIDRPGVAAKIAELTGGAAITTVILSHPDKDHINIVPLIPEAAHPKYVHYSGDRTDYNKYLKGWFENLTKKTTLRSYAANYFDFNPSTQVDGTDDQTEVFVLAANTHGDINTQSIVIKIVYQNNSVLLTGDATSVTENRILTKWPPEALRSTVILFAHHGSSYSSITPFIEAVSPNIGIWSASATHKGYGHPRCDVIDVAGSMVDSTTKNGITIQSHIITCFDTPQGRYFNHIVSDGFFLTATQENILFRSDGTNYTVIVDKLN